MRIASLYLFVISGAVVASAEAAEIKSSDPSGTWKWTFAPIGVTLNSTLHLMVDGNKITGRYEDENMNARIRNGKFTGKKLSFQFDVDFQGMSITAMFGGELSEDRIKGKIVFFYGGQAMEMDWDAERAIDVADVVGTWDLSMENSDDQTISLPLILKRSSRKLTGTFRDDNIGELTLENIRLLNNKMTFSMTGSYEGVEIKFDVVCRPRGSTMTGTLTYEVTGTKTEIEFVGKLRPKEKDV